MLAHQVETEVWYTWKEFKVVPATDELDEGPPRLLTPWADPMIYEEPADYMFETPEKAKEWKKEYASEENWILVKMTFEPIEAVVGWR